MSTRSGKRIHSSFHENSLKTDAGCKITSERKTRSKRLDDNNEAISGSTVKTKKRNNYVSYPTDDEFLAPETDKGKTEVNPSRVLRKNALKEVNATLNSESLPETTYLRRKSKRGKKLVEDTSEHVPEIENIENVQTEVVEKKSKKNRKKKDDSASNEIESAKKGKKKKKKGRQSSSMVVEDVETGDSLIKNATFDKSMSVDSFHSAAGSPREADIATSFTTDETTFENNISMSSGKISNTRTSVNTSVIDHGTPESNKTLTVENTSAIESVPDNINTSQIRRSSRRTLTNESKDYSIVNSSFTTGTKKRKSTTIDTTFDKSNNSISTKIGDEAILDVSESRAKKRKSILNGTYDKSTIILDTTFEKETDKKDSTYDKTTNKILDSTFEKDSTFDGKPKRSRSSINSNTFEKTEKMDATFEKDKIVTPRSNRKKSIGKKFSLTQPLNTDLNSDNTPSKIKSPIIETSPEPIIDKINSTFDLENPIQSLPKNPELSLNTAKNIDTTLDKSTNSVPPENASKSSLISSDNSEIDKSVHRISITSDDSSENIINTTPVLIESSMDDSHIPKGSPVAPHTPLKREGTFTKESPEVIKPVVTPTKRTTLPAAGCTPYHVSKSSQKKSILNVTRSIEKGRGSLDLPRATKVMFCSPVDNPALFTQEKRKIIKSNLKGSNKSFVFEDRGSPRPVRKRSYTASDADEARAKRSRLGGEMQHSVDRLSRPRTSSATGNVSVSTPGQKAPTPSKGGKPNRTKLPNFAALHQKQFAKMESLDECQERKARRAKHLLTPTGAVAVLERSSPRGTSEPPRPKPVPKKDTPTKSVPTLESLRPGFTRFGFKLHLDGNPFSVPSKTVEKPEKVNGLTRQGTLPSLAGATSVRREAAKQAVMREKSFTEKRHVSRSENRTIIKGVRTNRRFELQMKMRNLE